MKIAFWGGPLDGQVHDVPKPGPVRHRVPTIEPVGWRDAPDRLELADMRVIIYYPRQLALCDGRAWWVMVPGDLSEDELNRLLAERGHPPVDTQGRGLKYIEEAL